MVHGDFWSKYEEQIPYLDKDALSQSGETFEITAVNEQRGGRFGDQWVLTVTLSNGDQGRISFAKTPSRNDKMRLIHEELTELGTESIPAKLRTFQTKQGQTGYDIAPPF